MRTRQRVRERVKDREPAREIPYSSLEVPKMDKEPIAKVPKCQMGTSARIYSMTLRITD